MKQMLTMLLAAVISAALVQTADARGIGSYMYTYLNYGAANALDNPVDPKLEVTVDNLSPSDYLGDYVTFGGIGSTGGLKTFDELALLSLKNITDDPLELYFVVEWEQSFVLNFDGPFDVLPQPGYVSIATTVTNPDVGFFYKAGDGFSVTANWYPYNVYSYEFFEGRASPWFTFFLEPGATTTFEVQTARAAFMPSAIPLPAGGLLLLSSILAPLTWRRWRTCVAA